MVVIISGADSSIWENSLGFLLSTQIKNPRFHLANAFISLKDVANYHGERVFLQAGTNLRGRPLRRLPLRPDPFANLRPPCHSCVGEPQRSGYQGKHHLGRWIDSAGNGLSARVHKGDWHRLGFVEPGPGWNVQAKALTSDGDHLLLIFGITWRKNSFQKRLKSSISTFNNRPKPLSSFYNLINPWQIR